ncbi:Gfo/Idh/MocA family protein [Streptomyces corynorhini]|uniref:Gfo/Idh/MocA family oxidoreductase n=1 Tax=Streptomyces corynorhini TaxID=2282652 RepID=A0A370BD58_9ACTN|nr:Gfo/Idh/MocA family oxidoreductase [Streptomyces corynorhini]RDG38174.1 gfo/Idh/MocA family oxidoreductase [Streptomyces corynorhini]
MTDRVLRTGVLGCAAIARRTTLPALAADPSVRLVAVASRSRAKAEDVARAFGCEAVTGYAELLARDDIDAVYVPLPPALHTEWVGRALAAGKHVLAEKPLTTNLADAAELVAAARTAGLLLMENFAFLHHGQHDAVRALVDEGAIGEVRHLTAEFGFPPLPSGDIRYDPALGGGALLDAGVYTLRAASLYLGPETGVHGAVLRTDPGTGVDTAGAALVADPAGRTGQLSFGFDRAYRCAVTLWGSEGTLTLDRAFTAPPTLRPVLRLTRQDLTEERTLPAGHQFGSLISHFARTALDGGDLKTPGEDLLRQATLVDAVRQAAGG